MTTREDQAAPTGLVPTPTMADIAERLSFIEGYLACLVHMNGIEEPRP